MPEKKDYVGVSKGVHKQNFATCKNLFNLQQLYTAFKEKHPNVNIGFSKFCVLRPKWCVLAGSKMTHSAFEVLIKCFVASRCNGLGLDIQRPDQINFVFVFPLLRSLFYYNHS